MPLQISDFVKAAGQGDKQVLEVRESGQLRSSGFFRRTFKAAGQDVPTNQATMQAFVDSVRREKNAVMATMAGARLMWLTDGGSRPLTGRIVKTVMQEMALQERELKRANEQFFQRVIDDQGPNGLRALASAQLPAGSPPLAPKDLKIFADMLRFRMEACTKAGKTMTPAEVQRFLVSGYREKLARLTPEGRARLDSFVEHHQDHGLTRAEAETLRSLMLSYGVTSEAMIGQTAALFNRCRDLPAQMAACRDGGDLAIVYHRLEQNIHSVFLPGQPTDGPDPAHHAIPAVIQAVFTGAGYTPDRLMGQYANVVKGRPGSELCCACGLITANGSHPDQMRARSLLGMQEMVSSTMGLMLGVQELNIEIPGSRATFAESYDRMDEIPRGTAQALRALGCAIPGNVYSQPEQEFGILLDFTAGKGTVPAEDWHRLLQSAGTEAERGNLCNVGLGAMFEALPRLKAAEPGGTGPFSPQNVWRAVFNEPPPPDVTPENLSASVGADIERRLTDHFGPWVAAHQGAGALSTIGATGLPWPRAFELLATPGEVRFADLPVPPAIPLTGAPTWELERATVARVTGDTHRREGDSTLTIGGHPAIRLRQPVPSPEEMETAMADMTQEQKDAYLERVEELKNYHHRTSPEADRGVYNFVASDILTQVTGLVGAGEEARAQRIGVLEALTQTTSNLFRILSPVAGPAVPGAALHEHSAYDTTVTRDGDLIRVRLETPPGSPMRGGLEYSVDRRGTITMTDLSIGQEAV